MINGLLGMALFGIAPLWTGHHALRGFMKARGIDLAGIPLQCSRELAEQSYEVSRFIAGRKGRAAHAAAYTESLEVTAEKIRAIYHESDRSSPYLRSCHRLRDQLVAMGMRPPEITAPRD